MFRIALFIALLLVACDEENASRAAGSGTLPVLKAYPLPSGQRIKVDGQFAEQGWRRAKELTVELKGPGAPSIKLKALHDGERLYLLAIWPDPSASLGRYWEYAGKLEWRRFETEDGLSICWAPGAERARFKEQGCALFCHDGRHVYPGNGSGFVDFWYFGAQQTKYFPQARDMWLRQGEMHRLRGDNQPEGSDNRFNFSDKYEGPRFLPTFRTKRDERLLFAKNLKEVTPEWISRYWTSENNLGRQVPLDILRPRLKSRGDVANASRFYKDKGWVLELSRALRTGNPDDLPLGDPILPALFAVAVNDGAKGPNHAMSGPILLEFVTAN